MSVKAVRDERARNTRRTRDECEISVGGTRGKREMSARSVRDERSRNTRRSRD